MFTETHLQAFDSVVRQLKIAAYLCGGTVRDLLLGRSFHDVDVVLSADVFEAADLFRAKLNAPSFVLDRDRQVARVVFSDGNWDFTGFRNHTIEGDLGKRDFSINALAVRWEDYYASRKLDLVIDPFNGLSDLHQKLIRSVAPGSLVDDPLRMLRAFRMNAELHFTLDPGLLEQIEQLHSSIVHVAGERIRDEFDRIFLQPDSALCWRRISSTRLFGSLFPEMNAMKGCEQGGYHHLDVWDHSLLALENFEGLLSRLAEVFAEHDSALLQYLTAAPGTLDRRRILKWAVVMHDIGKPPTRELREPGRWRFHGHDHAGVDLAQTLLARLKFARKDTQMIGSLIEHHLRPLHLFNQTEINDEAFYRYFRATGADALGVLLISCADVAAARGTLADPLRDSEFPEFVNQMMRYYYREYFPKVNTPELIKGRDLMAILQMKPGPLMGELLREIRENQLTGALKSREDALEFARNWVKHKE